jgi:hypothetical protein
VTLNQTKFFTTDTFADVYFKVSYWDKHLSSHLQCHFTQAVEGAYTRYTSMESVKFTSPIVQEDMDSDVLRCNVPINKVGPIKIALMDASNEELVSSSMDMEVFEQIEIKTEQSQYIFNESMSFTLETSFNLKKIEDIEIQCLLNNITIGNFFIESSKVICSFDHFNQSISQNKIELLYKQSHSGFAIISKEPAYFTVFTFTNFTVKGSPRLNFFYKTINEPLRLTLAMMQPIPISVNSYFLSNFECLIFQTDQDRVNPREVKGVLSLSS